MGHLLRGGASTLGWGAGIRSGRGWGLEASRSAARCGLFAYLDQGHFQTGMCRGWTAIRVKRDRPVVAPEGAGGYVASRDKQGRCFRAHLGRTAISRPPRHSEFKGMPRIPICTPLPRTTRIAKRAVGVANGTYQTVDSFTDNMPCQKPTLLSHTEERSHVETRGFSVDGCPTSPASRWSSDLPG